jgi:ADP-heptose:LPS heptosyltransferase
LLQRVLESEPWTDDLLRAALAEDDGRAFFRVVVERLGDLFEQRLCDEYARLFARVIELVTPQMRASDLVERYQRVRQPRICSQEPSQVFVLSRVTLGADIAVTSIVLDAAKRRFPNAVIFFVGSKKNWELFAADERILHYPFAYSRHGSIAERVSECPRLYAPDSIVIDPDSRLSQLGLLPMCAERDYYFFESRGYGGEGDASLVELTREWARATFGVTDAQAWLAPQPGPIEAEIAVSFGVGENAEKRVDDPFEEQLLRLLTSTGASVLIDEGAGEEETQRIRRLCARIPGLRSWNGAYAPFAYAITRANQYVGYDSAGQHVAAASGTPLLSIFAGYASERMFQRWRPFGGGPINILKVEDRNAEAILEAARQYLTL